MKSLKIVAALLLAASFAAAPLSVFGAEQKPKAKPYPLKVCVVSDEKLGEMGDPYTFVYKDREVKLCCKSCLKDFNKNPAKYVKKMEEAEAKAKKQG